MGKSDGKASSKQISKPKKGNDPKRNGKGEGKKGSKNGRKIMKMQKVHKKQEKAVKDSQMKIGPTKRIAKLSKDAQVKTAAPKAEVVKKQLTEPLVQLQDNVKDQLQFVKQKKVDQGALKKAVKRLDAKAARVPLKNTPQNCTLYVGHLPYGLMEDQLKTYFTQYGDVTRIKVARSRKTARSKGYAFIQFEHPEVAAIAAKAMHGHMALGKVLEVHVLTADQKNPFAFKDGKKQFKYINWKRLFVKEQNEKKNPEELKKQVGKLLKNEKKRREAIQKLGIEYDFPGFEGILNGTEVEQAENNEEL